MQFFMNGLDFNPFQNSDGSLVFPMETGGEGGVISNGLLFKWELLTVARSKQKTKNPNQMNFDSGIHSYNL